MTKRSHREQSPVNLPPVPPPKPLPPPPLAMTPEEHEKYVGAKLDQVDSNSVDPPIKPTLGKCLLVLMQPQGIYAPHHPASPLLLRYSAQGCPVDCGPAWPLSLI